MGLLGNVNAGLAAANNGLATAERARDLAVTVSGASEKAMRGFTSSYRSKHNNHHGGCGCLGGSESFSGGLDELSEGKHAVYSSAKANMIKNIATKLNDEFKMGLDLSADPKRIIEQISAKIPNPKNKSTLSSDPATLHKICLKTANTINDSFGEKIIDINASDEEMCAASMEVINSLTTSLHSEFLMITTDVKRSIKNIKTLMNYLGTTFGNMYRTAENSSDPVVKQNIPRINSYNQIVQKELDRQLNILENLLSVTIDPIDSDIVTAISENNDFKQLVNDIKKGTPETIPFNDKLAFTLTGLKNAVQAANSVRAALQIVGVSMDTYRNTKDIDDEIFKSLKSMGTISADKIQNIVRAVDMIKKNEYQHDDIVKALNQSGANESSDDEDAGVSYGGAVGDRFGKKMDRRIAAQDATVKALERTFLKRVAKFYDMLFNSVNNIAKKVGNTIPLSEDLSKFITAFSYLELLEKTNIVKALTGQDNSSVGIDMRNKVASYLREISLRCDVLLGTSEYFRDIKNAVDGINDTIAVFSKNLNMGMAVTGDIAEQKTSRTLELLGLDGANESLLEKENQKMLHSGANELSMPDLAAQESGGVYPSFDNVYPMDESLVVGDNGEVVGLAEGDEFTTKNPFSDKNSIAKTVMNMKYLYKIAKIRSNLAVSAKELVTYREDYEDLLGEAIAQSIETVMKEGKEKGESAVIKALTEPKQTDLKEWYRLKSETHVNLYKVAEAVDLYLAAITDGLANHPDEIKSMVDILDSVKVIVKFFTDKTGDNLARFFDQFPSTNVDDKAFDKPSFSYIDYIYNTAGAVIGDGRKEIDSDKINTVLKHAKNAVMSFQGLKNLVSVFTSIGNKFDSTKNLLLTPVQIHEYLSAYVYVTAIDNGAFAPTVPRIGDADKFKVRYVCNEADGVNGTGVNYPSKSTSLKIPQTPKYEQYLSTKTAGNVNDHDYLFVDIIKAMAGKVLTVVKTYTLFNKPVADRETIYKNPVRVMLGGADSKVMNEVFELYVRLPLMAEFYKEVFSMENKEVIINNNTSYTNDGAEINKQIITFIPEFNNVWGDLITLVFDSARYVKEGFYSRSHVNDIINAVNKIYETMRSRAGDNLVQSCALEFVAEINRRYGVISRSNANKYEDAVKERRKITEQSYTDYDAERTNYEILPDESEPSYRKIAPSDRYYNGSMQGLASVSETYQPNEIDSKDGDLVKNFRHRIDAVFNAADVGSSDSLSFAASLKQAQAQLERVSESEKVDFIMKTIHNSNKIMGSGKMRYMFLHETVFAGMVVVKTLVNAVKDLIKDPMSFNKLYSYSGLLTIRADSGRVDVSADDLTSAIDSQMQFMRYVLDKFRIDVPKAIISQWDTEMSNLDAEINDVLKDSEEKGIGMWASENIAKLSNDTVKNNMYANVNNAASTEFDDLYVRQDNGTLTALNPVLPVNRFNDKDRLIPSFNKSMSDLLTKLHDPSVNKYYLGLIEPLTQGPLGNAINSAQYNNNNNSDDCINDFNANLIGKENNVLYQSIAFAIQKILTLRDKSDVNRIRVVSTLAEVSATVKDKMRCYLPSFMKQFDTIADKANFIVNLMDADLTESKDKKPQLMKLIQACKSVKSVCAGVYRELDDQPQYLEFYRGSLDEYKQNYNKTPLTPLSSLLYAVKKNVARYGMGDFKYNFGVRGILYGNDNTSYSHVIFDEYNASSEGLGKVEADKYKDFVATQLKFIRLMHESLNYKNILCVDNDDKASFEWADNKITTKILVDNKLTDIKSLYDVSDINKVYNTTESNKQDDVLEKYVEVTGVTVIDSRDKGAMGSQRLNAQVMNILDLNIMPINVNALMRDVPLTNIYNYSYTFDRVLSACYGYKEIPRIWEDIRNTQDSFVKLLINPYYVVGGSDNFYQHIGRIMVGVSDMNLGRPRFLSDQLWSKVLVQPVYTKDNVEFNEDPDNIIPAPAPAPSAAPVAAAPVAPSAAPSFVSTLLGKTNVKHIFTGMRRALGDKIVSLNLRFINDANIAIARGRFDSVIVRNLYFITNVQRMLMKLMRDEFVQINDPVAAGATLLDRRMTEYDPTNQFSSDAPYQA